MSPLRALLLALGALACSTRRPPRAADLLLENGRVHTLDPGRPRAEAIAIAGGRIVFVGPTESARGWKGPATRAIDLRGATVLPGFHDAHVHPAGGGLRLGRCDLTDLATAERVLETVRAYAAAHPDLPWIRGGGWDLPLFPGANPHRSLLDSIVPDRPVYLSAADGHSAWVNTRALALAGITRETPDPPTGRIERDPATGEPTGTLREDAADLVAKLLPPSSREERIEGLRRGLAFAARNGITSILDASADEEVLESYRALEGEGPLPVRVLAAIPVDAARGVADVPRLVDLRRRFGSRAVRPIAAKVFVDGVIESGTAALLEPYLDRPGERGIANLEPAPLDALVEALDREGFQLHFHAIGDRGVRMALDSLERARARNGPRDARPHLAHVEMIDPADVARFRRLGAVPNFQPLWACADPYITDLTIPVLGPERSSRLYPIGSLTRAGAPLAFGSDWPVTSIAPLEGIQVAVTRRGPTAGPGPAWLPDEAVDLPTALAGYTSGAAFALFQEEETGTIEPGKSADLVVLDRDPFDVPPEKLHEARVLLTIREGRETHRGSGYVAGQAPR
ncbi:MAG: amidohydrolase [Planctomycetes bacterium]|nr:amidohydrolase [Planctomycetota bacterium]